MRCYHCNADTTNGLALCDLCRRYAASALEFLPIYYRNLSRWRPGRAGARPVPGSRVLWDGETGERADRISDSLDAAMNMLTTRARELVDDRPHLARLLDRLAAARAADVLDDAQTVAWLCAGFRKWLTSISTLDWCGDFVTDLSEHEERLRVLTEAAVPGWYAGACRRCESPTYVVPGFTWLTCQVCGTTTHAADHLDTILAEARGWVARPKRIAEALVALLDTEESVPRLYERIKKMAQRGRLSMVQHTTRDYEYDPDVGRLVVTVQPSGPKRYRLGEVLDRVLTEGATRAADDEQAS